MQSALGARATASNVAGAALTRACIGPLSRTGGNSSLAASIRMLSASAASATKAATRRGGGRRVLKLLGVTAVAGGVAGAAYAQVDEGFRRSCKFWGVAFPIFLHYRAVQSYIALRGLGDEEGDVSAARSSLPLGASPAVFAARNSTRCSTTDTRQCKSCQRSVIRGRP